MGRRQRVVVDGECSELNDLETLTEEVVAMLFANDSKVARVVANEEDAKKKKTSSGQRLSCGQWLPDGHLNLRLRLQRSDGQTQQTAKKAGKLATGKIQQVPSDTCKLDARLGQTNRTSGGNQQTADGRWRTTHGK